MKNSRNQTFIYFSLAALVIIVLIGLVFYDRMAQIRHFSAERDWLVIGGESKLISSSFASFSQADLPHYAPHAVYFYSYDKAKSDALYQAVLDSLTRNGITITGHDKSTPGRNVGVDWYLEGEDKDHKINVSYQAQAGSLRLFMSRVGDSEPDSQ